MSGMAWIAKQIEGLSQPPQLIRFNPRPPGVIREGSATEAVLTILRESPGRFFVCEQLIKQTGRTHAAVSFALLYLRDQSLIEAYPDATRNPRFLRYRFKQVDV
jgi:hypothetical protein